MLSGPEGLTEQKINICKLSKGERIREYLGRVTNILECHLGIETMENALLGDLCPWPPPQSSKAILNHFSEQS